MSSSQRQERLQGHFSTSPAAARPPRRKALAARALPVPASEQDESKAKDTSMSRLHCRPPGRFEGSDQGLDRSPGATSLRHDRSHGTNSWHLCCDRGDIAVLSSNCTPCALPALPGWHYRRSRAFRLASRRQFRMESWLPSHKTHSWKNRGSSQVGETRAAVQSSPEQGN